MRDDLLHYYERELVFLRRMGAEFAQRYPKIAARLQLEATKCDDPHVERILEGFAFLAARVHLKIDDDFPEVTEALFNIVYPHYIRPLPAMSIAEFRLDPAQGKLAAGLRIPRDARLESRRVGGQPATFRTSYETTLWPVSVTDVQWLTPDRLRPPVKASDAVVAVRLELACFADGSFSELDLSTLRLYLHSEGNVASTLYEVLCNNCVRVLVRDLATGSTKVLTLPPSVLTPVGLGPDEGMLPYPGRSFVGYRLLQEYFALPEKFMFLDLAGFEQVRAAGFGSRVEVVFLIAPFERFDRRTLLEAGLTAGTIRLGCTPIVNLFPKVAEPILLDQRRPEYQLVPDVYHRETIEVFSIDDVVGVTAGGADTYRFAPFYSHRHGERHSRQGAMFWNARRQRATWREDGGSEILLSFSDLTGRTVHPDFDTVTARLTCFNGDLPSRLAFGDEGQGDFEYTGAGPVQKVIALLRPTRVAQPPLGTSQMWRLISQLSLNYLSIVDGGTEALQEILRLHNFTDTTFGERHIAGLVGVRSEPAFARVVSENGLTFARGRRVELDFDEEQFAGGGVYLFASVLERFLGLYASVNAFVALTARTRQRKEALRVWPPRAGWTPLL